MLIVKQRGITLQLFPVAKKSLLVLMRPLPILPPGGQKFTHAPALFTLELLWKPRMHMHVFSGKNRGSKHCKWQISAVLNLYCLFQLIIENE